ncbi:hypothetical protein IW147_005299 [Coemansia sp. RSA 720]|nr:hypothetical protein IW147_005299 [Coemansia sp. RSA 720]
MNGTYNLFNQSFSNTLPATGNAATGGQPNIGAVWDNFLIEAASELEQSRLQQSLLQMSPAVTLEGLGTHAPAVQEPIVAGGGLPQYPFPALADAPAAPEMTQHQDSKPGRARNVCKVCSRDFTRPSSLKTHMRSHTGEKPYKCNYPGCFKRFSVLSNQRRHSKLHVNPALPRGPRSQYMLIDMRTGRIIGYRRYSDPLN